jgi:hypothetical protein
MTVTELVTRRVLATSRTFAAELVTGSPDLPEEALQLVATVRFAGDEVTERGRPLRWGQDLVAGDLLEDGSGHWLVAVADDGDGLADGGDTVAHCWRSPPALTALALAVDAPAELRLRRHER